MKKTNDQQNQFNAVCAEILRNLLVTWPCLLDPEDVLTEEEAMDFFNDVRAEFMGCVEIKMAHLFDDWGK